MITIVLIIVEFCFLTASIRWHYFNLWLGFNWFSIKIITLE